MSPILGFGPINAMVSQMKRSDIILGMVLVAILISGLYIVLFRVPDMGISQKNTGIDGSDKKRFQDQFEGETTSPNEKVGPTINTDGIKVNQQDSLRSPNFFRSQSSR